MAVVRGKSSFAVRPGYQVVLYPANKETGHQTKGVGAGGGSLVAMPPPSEEAEALGISWNDVYGVIINIIIYKSKILYVLNYT